MAPKFTSFLAIALYISYSTSSFLPGESELTFPLLPRQNNCPGYYSDECDCSDPYVTVCDVGGIEWFPDLPADPSPPTQPPPSSTEVSNVPVPTDPGCDKKTAEDVTKDFVVTTGDVVDRKDLVYRIRQALCNDGSCPLPEAISNTTALATPNGSECEIAIALEGGSEVYGYRGTAPDGTQWQQCWDETESILEKCVKKDVNTGWLNGPAEYQFYQLGYRAINGEGSKHKTFENNDILLSKKGRCKQRCAGEKDKTWQDWCVKNCKCSYETRPDGAFIASCPL